MYLCPPLHHQNLLYLAIGFLSSHASSCGVSGDGKIGVSPRLLAMARYARAADNVLGVAVASASRTKKMRERANKAAHDLKNILKRCCARLDAVDYRVLEAS